MVLIFVYVMDRGFVSFVATEQRSCIYLHDKMLIGSFMFVYGIDGLCLSSPIAETEAVLESEDGQVGSQNIPSDTVASFAASGETQMDGGKANSKCSPSPLYYDNKIAYSSMVGLR